MPTDIKKLHADWLEELEIGMGRSAKTVENYDRYLRRFFKQQSIKRTSDITADAVRAFRKWLNESVPRVDTDTASGVSLATQNYHLIALRQFLKYLIKRDVPVLSPDKVGLAKLGERDIDVLYPEEVDALLTAASIEPTVSGLRDKAVLEVLYSTGMRVSEAVSLDRDDLRTGSNQPSPQASARRSELVVRGKGNKVRVVFLSGPAQNAVAAYIKERDDIDPALFVRHGPNRADEKDLRLHPRSVQRMIKKYAVAGGLTKTVTPHTLRHSFATDLLANGADVRQVQQLLGHASITTTQAYTHLTDVHLREIHDRYHRAGGEKSN